MFAIIQSLGHQYKVQLGQFVRMEKLSLEPGSVQRFQVLAVKDQQEKFHIGTPFVDKAEVKGRIVRHGRTKKVLVFKKNRRKGYRLTQGHRQDFTEIYMESFLVPGAKAVEKKLQKAAVKTKAVEKKLQKTPVKTKAVTKKLKENSTE